jgi:hypothetical protein
MPAYNKKTYYRAEVFWKSGRRSHAWKFEKPRQRSIALKNAKKNSDYLGCRTWETTE